MKIVFVCSANLNRSPTFESWFKENHPEYEVRSSGCWYGYPQKLDQELLEWADWIFVMDLSHEMHIAKAYPTVLHKVRVVGVSDEYDWNEERLRDIVAYWYENHFKVIEFDSRP